MKRRIITFFVLAFCVSLVMNAQTGERYKLEFNKKYAFKVVGEENLVMAYYEGDTHFKVEPYQEGNANQLFKVDYFTDNEEGFFNFSNIATGYTWDDHGTPKPQLNPTDNLAWTGWDLEQDEDGNIRFCHFLQRWGWTETWKPEFKGIIMFLSGDEVLPFIYERSKVAGQLDNTAYEAEEGNMFDFKVAYIGDITNGVEDTRLADVNAFGHGKSIYLNQVDNLQVEIYTLDGKIVNKLRAAESYIKIDVQTAGVYIVKVENKVFKVSIL